MHINNPAASSESKCELDNEFRFLKLSVIELQFKNVNVFPLQLPKLNNRDVAQPLQVKESIRENLIAKLSQVITSFRCCPVRHKQISNETMKTINKSSQKNKLLKQIRAAEKHYFIKVKKQRDLKQTS